MHRPVKVENTDSSSVRIADFVVFYISFTNSSAGPMDRINAYKDCILNTCIRFTIEQFPDITLTTCKKNKEFRKIVGKLLLNKFFDFVECNNVNHDYNQALYEILVEFKK